ncbi:hypothetical protein E2C01_012567 [Portunus trituberculatus]|uniref:Uncharacterized protein n=1 Tax=Portunus trituberculatus TaxID=210409 RepID=A0A5B7DEH0_PORTR|nr:hypothetical protein [Portunus trituberculatus]
MVLICATHATYRLIHDGGGGDVNNSLATTRTSLISHRPGWLHHCRVFKLHYHAYNSFSAVTPGWPRRRPYTQVRNDGHTGRSVGPLLPEVHRSVGLTGHPSPPHTHTLREATRDTASFHPPSTAAAHRLTRLSRLARLAIARLPSLAVAGCPLA